MRAPRGRAAHEGDEELAAVGVWAAVGHAEHARRIVLHDEALVLELGAIDGLAASACPPAEALGHQ